MAKKHFEKIETQIKPKSSAWYVKYWHKLSTSLTFVLWNLLFLSSLIGLVFSLINSFTLAPISTRANVPWKEHFMFFLYFTNMSSTISLVTSYLVIINKFTPNHVDGKRVKNLMVTALTITVIFYWAVVFPKKPPSGQVLMSGLIVHGITPLLSLIVFLYEAFTIKFVSKASYLKTVGYNFIFPFLYLIMGIILYYSLGQKEEDAIYSFFDFSNGNVSTIIIIMVAIAIAFPSLSALYALCHNYSLLKTTKKNIKNNVK